MKKKHSTLISFSNSGTIKLLITMKLALIITFLSILQVSANIHAQAKINLTVQDKSISEVLKSIEQQSHVRFFYSNDLLIMNDLIDLNADDEMIIDVLDKIFSNSPLTYKVYEDDLIVIVPRQLAQQQRVTGTVYDAETGMPLPGVNILVQGTLTGTVTDLNGNYSIDISDPDVILQVSYIGYETAMVPIDGRSVIEIRLATAVKALEEVVVIGYGTQKRSDLTGSLSSVKGEQIISTPVAGIDQALQGKAAGVTVMSNSGTPGGSSSIRIRGTGSLYSSNEPLFVLDGIPVGSDVVNLINPNDVENVEVLKDASAAAIYGSRGANGVILVTTKRGKAGTPKINFDSYFGIKHTPKNYEMGDAAQYIQIYLLGKKASGAPINDINVDFQPYYNMLDGIDFTQDYSSFQDDLYHQIKEDYRNSTDWWNELIHNGFVQTYNFSISGGSESFKYASSIGYYDEKGMIKTSGFNRLTFRLNADYIVNKKLKLGANFTVVNTHRSSVGEGTSPIISDALQMDPITPVTRSKEQTLIDGGNPDNSLDLFSPALYTTAILNPVAALERNMGGYDALRLLGNGFIEYSIFSGLVFKSTFGLVVTNGKSDRFSPVYYLNTTDRNAVSTVSEGSDYANSWNWVNQLTYAKDFGNHSITGMAAVEAYHDITEGFTAAGQNTPSNDEAFRYLSMTTQNPNIGSTIRESSLISYIGRINYSYANKYLFTGTFRRDGSSKFASGNRWGNFTSFALGYKISEEAYFKNLNISFINNLKIRGGWGQLGNSNIPGFAYLSQYKLHPAISYAFGPTAPYSGGGSSAIPIPSYAQGIVPSIIGNPAIKWETQEQSNIGLDLGILNNRLTLTADYFIRTTKDNLIQEPIPGYVGYPNIPWTNNGKIENRGFEFTTEFRSQVGELKYGFGGNISFVKNKVLSLGEGKVIPGGFTRINGNGTITQVGSSIADFIGYKTDRIFHTQEEVSNHQGVNGTVLQPNAKPGDFRFANTKNDDVLNDDDRIILGSALPKFTYGVNVNLEYKGLELKLFFQGQYGNKILMSEKYYLNTGQGFINSVKDLPNIAWHGPGTSNSQPRIVSNDINLNFRMSDFYLEDGSYTRLKNAQLAYNFPKSVSGLLKITNIMVYVSGENLLTFTKYPGIDPEMHSSTISEMMSPQLGLSTFGYPQAKTFIAGIKIDF